MDKIFNWTSTVIGIVGGFFVAIFGQWDSIFMGAVGDNGVGLSDRSNQGDLHKNNVK